MEALEQHEGLSKINAVNELESIVDHSSGRLEQQPRPRQGQRRPRWQVQCLHMHQLRCRSIEEYSSAHLNAPVVRPCRP